MVRPWSICEVTSGGESAESLTRFRLKNLNKAMLGIVSVNVREKKF